MKITSAAFPVFGHSISAQELVEIDLSSSNVDLKSVNLDDQAEFEKFIQNSIASKKGKAGIGGYLENRVIYRRSKHFNDANSVRCIHLGIDVWMPAGTKIYAPFSGTIHSFGINDNYADYGGTLILQHQLGDEQLFSLYGHISHASLYGIVVGDKISAGDLIARLGTWNENGNWPPHLHFQVILNMLDYSGDFPGVCAPEDKNYFKNLCPDPYPYLF